MGFTSTPEERKQAEKGGSLILPLPGATGAESGTFHNPVTGQEIVNQPIDAYHLTRRLRQGWRMGSASAELKEKWVIREAELKAEDDKRVADYLASGEHQTSLDEQAQGFNDAVASAVAQALKTLGVEAPNEEKRQAYPQEEEEAPEVDHQLDFFKTIDASAESETKLIVSPASRPGLHLVE